MPTKHDTKHYKPTKMFVQVKGLDFFEGKYQRKRNSRNLSIIFLNHTTKQDTNTFAANKESCLFPIIRKYS